MADPQDLLNGGYLYTESEPINEVMIALYGISTENMIQGDIQLENLPATEEIEQVYDDLIGPFLDSDANHALSLEDIRGLIVNLVLYDASLDDSLYGQDLPATYQPRQLLELIQYDGLDDVVLDIGHGERHHIFHWASERLFPYFLDNLEEKFVRSEFDDAVGPHGNTYLHSYLESSFRIRNPAFVTYLLDLGFSLSAPNDDGDTPLHLMVYQSREYEDPFPNLSKEEHKAMRNDLVRRGNALALRRYHNRMKRYNRYYQTLILLFRHGIHIDGEGNIDHPDLRIENDQGITVGEIIYGADHSYPVEDLREAHEVAMGRPSAVERGRKQKLTEALRRLPRNITNRIRNSQGANLERARAVIKHRQMNNTRRKKEMVHRQLLNRASSEHSGGRRTRRAKKRAHTIRKTRRGDTSHAS
jgi:hypothetical protein